jgi:hypothetical protein
MVINAYALSGDPMLDCFGLQRSVRQLFARGAGSANFLVTGDERDPFGLNPYKGAKIITVRDFFTLYRRLP